MAQSTHCVHICHRSHGRSFRREAEAILVTNAFELLQQLVKQNFYGSVEFKFEAGSIVLLRKPETIKPKSIDAPMEKTEAMSLTIGSPLPQTLPTGANGQEITIKPSATPHVPSRR